jgi:2,5-dioxopentanoate dehydrogenase
MQMQLTGETLIGSRGVSGSGEGFHAVDPVSGNALDVEFFESSTEQIDEACVLAGKNFDAYRAVGLEERARFLEAIADGIQALGDVLIERAMSESGLPRPRLEGERARTANQLRLFASLVREGRFLDATLDSALPDRKPLPRSDLRLRKIPLGPVAVFGASNFPLAFSVAGGDTASALAAGCPVVVKAHPSHPGTSELIGRVIQQAVSSCGMPVSVFSLVGGRSNAVGEALVNHPAIRAVGFTGSRRGGLALTALAARRAVPIPVFAEMSSTNPVFLLPAALAARAETIAQAFVDSATLGTGQFCTQPGIVFGVEGPEMERFIAEAAKKVAAKPSAAMLNPAICDNYKKGSSEFAKDKHVRVAAQGLPANGVAYAGRPELFVTDAASYLQNGHLSEELFGPSSLVVLCKDQEELFTIAEHLGGELTATLQMDTDDTSLAQRLLPILERKAGRILANGFPTGVEVSHAMVHGGPYPATSDSRSTSVGALAIERFLRPVCYQDIPATLLPQELQDENTKGLWRLKNGTLTQE